jgi:acyltransferase
VCPDESKGFRSKVLSFMTQPERIHWLDTAKAYGMLLVFYGHFVEKLAGTEDAAAPHQFKFIYSFHMPLFFILAGFVAKTDLGPFRRYVKVKLASRILPMLFFSAAMVPLWLVRDIIVRHSFHPDSYLMMARWTAYGVPLFCLLTWFLVCLFVVEVIHRIASPFLTDTRKVAISCLLFYGVGWELTWAYRMMPKPIAFVLTTWYLSEAILAYAFYQVGILIRMSRLCERVHATALMTAVLCVCAAIALCTYDLNPNVYKGQFRPHGAVIMSASLHGHPLLFPATAVAGSVCVIALAAMTPPNPAASYVGMNSLAYMGLASAFFEFFNGEIARLLGPWIPGIGIGTGLACTMVAILSMALSFPVVLLLDQVAPQLIGKPREDGPILPRLV